MSDFVNKVKKNDVEYEIQDARIPEATSEDAGKVLKVAVAGGYELGEAGGSSNYIPVYDGDILSFKTPSEIVATYGNKFINENCLYNFDDHGGLARFTVYITSIIADNDGMIAGARTDVDKTSALPYISAWLNGLPWCKTCPVLPTDASSKTYVLKAVNGTLTWVEETA